MFAIKKQVTKYNLTLRVSAIIVHFVQSNYETYYWAG
jgi:hypothetical protein